MDPTPDIKQLAAMTALNSMMDGGYVSICTIDNIAKMLGINPKGAAYDVLHTLHCVHFSKMPTELKDQLPDLIKQCLSIEPTYRFPQMRPSVWVDVPPEKPKRPGLLQRMNLTGR